MIGWPGMKRKRGHLKQLDEYTWVVESDAPRVRVRKEGDSLCPRHRRPR